MPSRHGIDAHACSIPSMSCLTCGLLLLLVRELINSAISRSPGASVSSCRTGCLRRFMGGVEGARHPVLLLGDLVLRFLKAPALQRQHVSNHCCIPGRNSAIESDAGSCRAAKREQRSLWDFLLSGSHHRAGQATEFDLMF